MFENLIIVESPAKCKTIKKYLGSKYEVLASYGHVRSLISKSGSVDTNNNFDMKYEVIEKNHKHLEAIKKALKTCKNLMLATDPDREGEAISWHILEYLKNQSLNKLLDNISVSRVVFNEITKKVVLDAVANPRQIDMNLVNAQQARSALDYLVGFNLSPLLWKKITSGLSAGRVQSPALRMICEREEEIKAFKTEEYWTIEATLTKPVESTKPFTAKLTEYDGVKVTQFSFVDEKTAISVKDKLVKDLADQLTVYKVDKKKRNRSPYAPFITSTLQQAAANTLGFSAQKTMKTAQSLYEGINLGSETIGLITYMRTDSVNLSAEAVVEIREFIDSRYGKRYLPDEVRIYKTKSKNAQEAHEAIRPTSILREPAQIQNILSVDQFKLYKLIWNRTLACQMMNAIMNIVAVDLGIQGVHTIRAVGSTIDFLGFLIVNLEAAETSETSEKSLPQMQVGDLIQLNSINPIQHFTEAPPRYSEASLVKTLEEYGIGRPSTYASIIATLQTREYVVLESKRFVPTDIGMVVSRFLVDHFTKYVDYQFTANLEDELDSVARGELDWIPLLSKFWSPFHELCELKDLTVTRENVSQSRALGIDPKTQKIVSVRISRFGSFAQLGTKEDEEKPRFAGLRHHQRIDTISLDEALQLFILPRILGEDRNGEIIKTNIGRFGPYIQIGKKFISLKGSGPESDPYLIDLDSALKFIDEYNIAQDAKTIKTFEQTVQTDQTVQTIKIIKIIKGRFGPYITNGEKNIKIPKDLDPESLNLEECLNFLQNSPEQKKKSSTKRKSTRKTTKTQKV